MFTCRPLRAAFTLVALLFSVSPSFQSLCKEGDLVRYVRESGENTQGCLNSSNPRANPCRTLNYALLEDEIDGNVIANNCTIRSITPDNLCIRLEDGIHRLTGEAQATKVTNLTIESVNPHKAVIRCRAFPNTVLFQWDNLALICSSQVTIEGVVIEYCGPINAGIYSEFSENILVQNTIIRNIIGIALELREGTDYVIRNCTFEENLNNISSNQPSFANLDFFQVMDLDNFLSLSSGGLNIYSMATVNALIEDSVFVRNTASNIGLHRDRPPLLQLDGHGGAVYVRLRNPNNSNIVFRNTVFDSNGAQIDGGAVYLSMSSGAGYNSIRFDNCSFYNNSVIDTSGGAISVVLFNASVGNKIAVQDCVFEGNSAHGGGAIGIVVYDVLDSEQNPDSVVIRNSTFRNNRAVREGSAVGIFSLLDSDTSPFEVLVHNSTFEDNEVGDLSVSDGSVARAAVSSFRFPIKFTGTNRFSRNIGGGLSVVDSLVTVAKNSHLIFEDNVAHFGGGLQQVGSCLVVVSEGAVVDFVRNRALILGGAIMVNSPVVDHATNFLNRFCFIRFSDPDVPPQSWLNVSINFINNTAKVGGAALYGTDLRRCSWFNISVDNLTDYTIFTPPANVSVPFVFSGNYITDGNANQIFKNGSLGTNAVATNISFLIEKLIIQPGESVTVNAVNIDRFGNSRSGVASVELIDSVIRYAISDIMETVSFRVPTLSTDLTEFGYQNITVTFRLQLDLGEESSFNFTLAVCHPGYLFLNGQCVCDSVDSNVLRCDANNRYVYVREGTFAYRNNSGGLGVLSGVPAPLLSCTRQGQLPGCLFMFDDPYDQCSDGRTGFLCGRCGDEEGVTLNLQSCASDCNLGIALFVIWSVGSVVIAIVLIVFNVELPAELRAFIFYVQVIGLVFGPYSIIVPPELKKFGFFLDLLTFGLPLPFCLGKGLPTFAVALIGFVTPLLALTVAILYAICAKFNSTVSSRGAIHGLSLLSLFIYKYLADVTFTIVSCRVTDTDFVFLYDGTQSCLSANFLPFFVIAVLIIFTVILPAPFILCVLTAKRWSKFDLYHFTDQTTKDVHPKRGWYAGWDIGRRLLFIIVFFGGVYFDISLRLLANFILAVIVLFIHVLTKPFKDDHNNVIEGLILFNLVIITISYLEAPIGTFTMILVVGVTVIPYLYAVGYLMILLVKKMSKRYNLHCMALTTLHMKLKSQHIAKETANVQLDLQESLLVVNSNDDDQVEEGEGSSEVREGQRRRLRPEESATEEDNEGNRRASTPGPAELAGKSFVRDIDLFDVSER